MWRAAWRDVLLWRRDAAASELGLEPLAWCWTGPRGPASRSGSPLFCRQVRGWWTSTDSSRWGLRGSFRRFCLDWSYWLPLGARIVAVVDVWDALSRARPYKKALPQESVIQALRKLRGTQLDPELVDCFLEIPTEQGPEMLNLIEEHGDG